MAGVSSCWPSRRSRTLRVRFRPPRRGKTSLQGALLGERAWGPPTPRGVAPFRDVFQTAAVASLRVGPAGRHATIGARRFAGPPDDARMMQSPALRQRAALQSSSAMAPPSRLECRCLVCPPADLRSAVADGWRIVVLPSRRSRTLRVRFRPPRRGKRRFRGFVLVNARGDPGPPPRLRPRAEAPEARRRANPTRRRSLPRRFSDCRCRVAPSRACRTIRHHRRASLRRST